MDGTASEERGPGKPKQDAEAWRAIPDLGWFY